LAIATVKAELNFTPRNVPTVSPVEPIEPKPPPSANAGPQYSLQIVRGPSEASARKMAAVARSTLGAQGASLAETVLESRSRHGRRRYTAFLDGFPTASAAEAACETLRAAKQDCVVRVAAASPSQAPTQPSAADTSPAQPSADQTKPAAPGTYFIQLSRGPSEEGAHRAIAKARKTLGALADGLTDSTEFTQLGRRRRYSARLVDFPTASAAETACRKLTDAGQTCFVRPVS
jgi:hypothetical protein